MEPAQVCNHSNDPWECELCYHDNNYRAIYKTRGPLTNFKITSVINEHNKKNVSIKRQIGENTWCRLNSVTPHLKIATISSFNVSGPAPSCNSLPTYAFNLILSANETCTKVDVGFGTQLDANWP